MALASSACTLNVNLNLATDKPLSLNLAIEKPIAVKLGADVALTKLPIIQTDSKIGFTDKTPTKP
jgi:hypothetical protein